MEEGVRSVEGAETRLHGNRDITTSRDAVVARAVCQMPFHLEMDLHLPMEDNIIRCEGVIITRVLGETPLGNAEIAMLE